MSWTNSLRNYLHPRVILVLFLGFLSGLPLGLLIDPLNFWLAEIGIKKTTIGLLYLVLLAYSLKMFWVWRKTLDFAAIEDVHAMKRQIHAVRGHGQIAVAGHNLKLGRGGIREIEFFV